MSKQRALVFLVVMLALIAAGIWWFSGPKWDIAPSALRTSVAKPEVAAPDSVPVPTVSNPARSAVSRENEELQPPEQTLPPSYVKESTPDTLRVALENVKDTYFALRNLYASHPNATLHGVGSSQWAVDDALFDAVRAAFEQLGDFEAVRKALGDIVDWQEMSKIIASRNWFPGQKEDVDPGYEDAPLRETAMVRPLIMYRESRTTSGAELVILQNGLIYDDTGGLQRLRTNPYAVLSAGKNIHISRLMNDRINQPVNEVNSAALNVLGAFDVGEAAPVIVTCMGPAGKVGNFSASFYLYVEAGDYWVCPGLGVGDQFVDRFVYNNDAGVLTLYKDDVRLQQFNLREEVRKQLNEWHNLPEHIRDLDMRRPTD